MRITTKDRRLLYTLSGNSRQSYSRMGRQLEMSQQMISYKMKQFQEQGIISSFYPIVDYSRLGFLSFKVYFKINYISKKRFQELLESLGKDPMIVEVSACGGRYDVLLDFFVHNPSSFNKALNDIKLAHPQLKNATILTTVVRHHFPPKYLIEKGDNKEDIVLGGDRELLVMDEIDETILRQLLVNASQPALSITKETGINPKTVISRIKNLQEQKVIRGFTRLLHLQDLDYKVNVILLRYHNLSPELEERLKNVCMRNQHVISFTKLIGKWDAEIVVESEDMTEFRNVYSMLREQFDGIIQDSEYFPILRTYKKQFLPENFSTV